MLKYDSIENCRVEEGYINRTRIYLYPAIVLLKSYKQFIANLKNCVISSSYDPEKQRIIVYYNRNETLKIKDLLTALKSNGEYLDDWMHNENVYAIALKPDLNYNSFESGSYTDIYRIDQINRVFTRDSPVRKVLTKDPAYKQTYVDLLNSWFNSKNSIEFLESRPDGSTVEISQYDIPPCLNQEILNYESEIRLPNGKVTTRTIN